MSDSRPSSPEEPSAATPTQEDAPGELAESRVVPPVGTFHFTVEGRVGNGLSALFLVKNIDFDLVADR